MFDNKLTKTKTSPKNSQKIKSPKRKSPKRKSPKRKSPKRKITKLPQLRDLFKKDRKDRKDRKGRNKKYKYHIHDSDFKRHRAINEGIKSKKTKS